MALPPGRRPADAVSPVQNSNCPRELPLSHSLSFLCQCVNTQFFIVWFNFLAVQVVVGAEIELMVQLGAKHSPRAHDEYEVDNHRAVSRHNHRLFQHSRGRNRNAGRRVPLPRQRREQSRYVDDDDDVYFSTQDELSHWCAVEDAVIERAILANERRRREKNWLERD